MTMNRASQFHQRQLELKLELDLVWSQSFCWSWRSQRYDSRFGIIVIVSKKYVYFFHKSPFNLMIIFFLVLFLIYFYFY